MAAGAEADLLGRIAHIRFEVVIVAFELCGIDEEFGRSGLAGEGLTEHQPIMGRGVKNDENTSGCGQSFARSRKIWLRTN